MSERPPYKESSELPFEGKLFDDTFNDWFGEAVLFVSTPDRTTLHPVRHYEDRQRELYGPTAAEEVIQASDSDAMRRYNQIVDEFNAEIDRINREKDVETVRRYLKRVKEVLSEGR